MPGSSKPSLILLYAGKDDAGALDAYLHAYNPAFSEYIWAVDIRRKGGDLGQDMLGEEPYLTTCAMAGKVACRTWSILRWFPKPGGPPPVRGRAEQTLWGLEDLEPRVMEDTHNDSVLMLRQMYLTSLAYKGPGQLTVPQVGSSFLEHRWTHGVQQEPERSEVLIDLGHAGLRSMGECAPPLPHQVR